MAYRDPHHAPKQATAKFKLGGVEIGKPSAARERIGDPERLLNSQESYPIFVKGQTGNTRGE
jgi:hypothetical protein